MADGCPALGQDCIYLDPLFVNATAGDYHLQIPTGSTPTPIDKGHNHVNDPQSDYYNVPVVDMEVSTRPVNIGTVPDYDGTDAYTDMGAYEAHQ